MQECNQRNESGYRHGYWEEYWKNGNLWYRGYYDDGKKNGRWVFFHSDNQPLSSGYFKDDIQISLWEFYSINKSTIYYARM